ncbi:putative isochorismatase hydrolase protein [Rosellinia necatrix]|uniref:Putative isochorismatase hydrolase protein n=1 Tax=Rosellinia necatrix TaxID=77044 RepID=A0A1W2TM36_ROSNE|nr:putative isochorismatase hydrolase protein [Rosellinia necatrix]
MASNDLHQPAAYPPSKTALLLLDYQNMLVEMMPSPGKESLIESVSALQAAARKNNVAILHCTMDTAVPPPATNKVAATWDAQFKPIFSANPHLGAEFAGFSPADKSRTDRETVFTRAPGIRSALAGEGIISHLRDTLGVNHLILGGIATSGAIMGTMSHATDIGFVVTVVETTCWDPNESVHRSLIDTVIPTLAFVSSVEEAVGYMTA